MTTQTTRKYSSRSQQTTLSSTLLDTATTAAVNSATTLLGGITISAGQTFTVVIDPDTSLEEIVDVTAVSGNNLTITRAIDGSTAQDHSAGAVVRHMVIGRDLREANTHEVATTGVHGLSNTSSVVGTQETQTLYNKTLIAPVLTATDEADSGITFEGATVDSNQTFLGVVDPTQDNTITLPNTSGTVILDSATQTLTNKTLTSPTIGGTPVITGLSSVGMSTTSATPKNYVDSILGSATAASTSAASAATSASSALVSQTAAATSATSAAASATAAATSATSAAASATAAATSATSSANSATAAAGSATTASGYVTTVAASATAAATSATSAAASATAAATSATSSATSASAALTSANSAATSAASAATSATSSATSASSSLATYNTYKTYYLGSFASAPTLDDQGNALMNGATYFNTSNNTMYVYSTGTHTWYAISSTSGYTAPTLGSTTLTSGSTITTVAGLTLTSPTLTTPTLGVASGTSLALSFSGSSSSQGSLSVGGNINGGPDTGLIATFAGAQPTYAYTLVQNTTNGASSYASMTVANNDFSSYIDVGVNSSTYSSTSAGYVNNSFTQPKMNFIEATGGDLTIGTWSSGTALHFVVGGTSATADSMSISSSTVTVPSLTLSGSLTAASSSGTSGQYLQSTGTGVQWASVSGYTAPTLGSTTLTSGATISTVSGLTLTAPIVTSSINAQTGTTYTPVASDAGSLITLNNASAISVTIPTNASVGYAVGSQLNFAWITGAGQPTISAVSSGTTTIISTGAVTSAPKLRVANSVATAIKIATDTWLVTGDIA